MNNRDKFIDLIEEYGVAMADPKRTTAKRIAARKAVEDFCDAQILDERAACALVANLEALANEREVGLATSISSAANMTARLIEQGIRARPAP